MRSCMLCYHSNHIGSDPQPSYHLNIIINITFNLLEYIYIYIPYPTIFNNNRVKLYSFFVLKYLCLFKYKSLKTLQKNQFIIYNCE